MITRSYEITCVDRSTERGFTFLSILTGDEMVGTLGSYPRLVKDLSQLATALEFRYLLEIPSAEALCYALALFLSETRADDVHTRLAGAGDDNTASVTVDFA